MSLTRWVATTAQPGLKLPRLLSVPSIAQAVLNSISPGFSLLSSWVDRLAAPGVEELFLRALGVGRKGPRRQSQYGNATVEMPLLFLQ